MASFPSAGHAYGGNQNVCTHKINVYCLSSSFYCIIRNYQSDYYNIALWEIPTLEYHNSYIA